MHWRSKGWIWFENVLSKGSVSLEKSMKLFHLLFYIQEHDLNPLHIYISYFHVLVKNSKKETFINLISQCMQNSFQCRPYSKDDFVQCWKCCNFPKKINQYDILYMFQNTFDVYDGNKKVLHCSSCFIILTGLKA